MRIFFCLMPALVVAAPMCFIEKHFALVVFIGVFGLGWDVTKAKPERGEFR